MAIVAFRLRMNGHGTQIAEVTQFCCGVIFSTGYMPLDVRLNDHSRVVAMLFFERGSYSLIHPYGPDPLDLGAYHRPRASGQLL
jgi:hypothetical protein